MTLTTGGILSETALLRGLEWWCRAHEACLECKKMGRAHGSLMPLENEVVRVPALMRKDNREDDVHT